MAISVKAGPSHESRSTGLKLPPLATFDVVEQRRAGPQIFLRLADGSGWAFVFNRRTGTVVAEDQGDAPGSSSAAARFRVAPGVAISVKAEPSHDSRSTGLKLQPLQEFEVLECRRVPGVRRDGGEQVFLRLPQAAGWAFVFNRRFRGWGHSVSHIVFGFFAHFLLLFRLAISDSILAVVLPSGVKCFVAVRLRTVLRSCTGSSLSVLAAPSSSATFMIVAWEFSSKICILNYSYVLHILE